MLGFLQLYSIPTTASEPTIKKGSLVWASPLKKTSLRCFIAYRGFDAAEGHSYVFVYRCMGMPGDVVEMKNGITFVNGANADTGFEVKRSYRLYSPDASSLLNSTGIRTDEDPITDNQTAYLLLNQAEVKLLNAACKPGIDSLVTVDMSNLSPDLFPFLYKAGKRAWGLDNFGPFKVPAGNYFLLGDNRHNAADSRFTGFVSQDSVPGVLIGK
jgi:signal peptidase I